MVGYPRPLRNAPKGQFVKAFINQSVLGFFENYANTLAAFFCELICVAKLKTSHIYQAPKSNDQRVFREDPQKPDYIIRTRSF